MGDLVAFPAPRRRHSRGVNADGHLVLLPGERLMRHVVFGVYVSLPPEQDMREVNDVSDLIRAVLDGGPGVVRVDRGDVQP